MHKPELDLIANQTRKFERLVELNVIESCLKVLKTGIVQRKRAQTGYPVIHGFVYHLHQGKLMELAIDLDKYQKRWDDVYKLEYGNKQVDKQ